MKDRGLLAGYLAVAGLVLAQLWFWGSLLRSSGFLAHSDLFEQFLPVFLSPFTIWSPYEFAGAPAFADPQNSYWYPLHALFRSIGWWSGYIVSAYVVASLGAYAYIYQVTRSRVAACAAGLAWPWCEALAEKYSHLQMLHAYAWLPVVLFCLERLGRKQDVAWTVSTAFTIATLVLTGHAQAVIYCLYLCGLYAGALWLIEARNRRLFGCLAVAFAAGAMLAAVQLVPLVELSGLMARSQVGFDQFADSFAKTPQELLTILIPQIRHDGREGPTYTGALLVLGVFLAVRWRGSRWRLIFWTVSAVVCLLLGLGSATPAGTIAYYVPLYDRFRVVARHLALYSFSVITLGCFGIHALMEGAWRPRATAMFGAIAGSLIGVAFWYVASQSGLDVDRSGGLIGLARFLGSDLAVQGAVWLASLAVMFWAASTRSRLVPVAIMAVLCVDLLASQPEPVTAGGFQPPTLLPAAIVEPSIHTRWLKGLTDARFDRLMPIAGSGSDPFAMGAFTRKWRVASAGGYGPTVLNHLSQLATVEGNGSIRPRVLLPEDRSLDILAVRYVIVRAADLEDQASDTAAETRPLELSVGRPDCGYPQAASLTFGVPPGEVIRGVELISYLRCAEDIPQGTSVATVTVVGRDGRRHSQSLKAGIDVSDAHHELRDVKPRVKHALATVFTHRDQGEEGATSTYVTGIDLGAPVDAERIEITREPRDGWLMVDRLSVTTGAGVTKPLPLLRSALSLSSRWQELRRVRTSRVTDRIVDEDGPDEGLYIVYQNNGALPRAWFAEQVLGAADRDALSALHTSIGPDATPFDPATTALVEPSAMKNVKYPAGDRSVHVTGVGDGRLTMSVATDHGGFLVVSEMWYPGWTAEIDRQVVPVLRANYAIMGVAVPPGRHKVTFTFRPKSLFIGGAMSGAALVALAGAFLVSRRGVRGRK